MFYTKSMEVDPGKKNSGENPWDTLREPAKTPEVDLRTEQDLVADLARASEQRDEQVSEDESEETLEQKQKRTDAKRARIAEHVLAAEEASILAREYFERDKAEAPERAKQHIANMVDTEAAFRKQLDRIESRGTAHISRKEFEIWEDDYAHDWDLAHQEMNKGGVLASADRAEIEQPAMMGDGKSLEKTIEAQAGHFFFERSEALSSAIQDSDDPNRAEDLRLLSSFFSSVQSHLDYKYTDARGFDAWEAEQYDRSRTKAHNELIKHLNKLNELAKKYGTRPFTMRNFWTSENSRVIDPPHVKQRMLHDRHQVEAYCATAFTRAVEAAKERASRANGFFY